MNAKDFGARGDCVHPGDYTSGCLDCVVCETDDAPALQRAIDAAQLAGRSLFIPAGVYLVNTTLLIRCTGARDPIEDNSPNPMCDGVLNATHRYHPLRLVGEGMESTMIQAGRPMPAVLELEAPAIAGGARAGSCKRTGTCGFARNVTGMHAIEHIHFHANGLANSSVMSFGVIRSRFANLAATSALQYGLSLHNGFINTIDGCKMHSNREAGVFVSENDNAIEITNSEPSGNLGHGIVIFGGAQISIHRNTIEGNGGAGILASGAEALDVTANYFEANTSPSVFAGNPNHEHGFVLRPAVTGVPGADAIALNADIVLNGADSWDEYGAADPNRGVRIASNYHAPQPNGSAVLMFAARGVVLDGNSNGDHLSPDPTTPLIRVGPSAPTAALRSKLWNVSDVTCRGNAAFPGLVRALRPGEPLPAGQRDAFAGCV